jgi:hypothetical protein
LDILERAKHRKNIANKILNELRLMEKWSEIGETYLVGAVAYDLIVNPDIDIETFCINPQPDKVFNILTDLSTNSNVVEIKYRNYMRTSFNGLYFKLLYKYENTDIWNIDMWLFPHNHKGPLSRDLIHKMSQVLTDEKRRIILRIKEGLAKEGKEIPSIYVYQSVIDNNIQHTEEFLEWVKKQEVNKLTTWKPHIKG